MEKSKKTAKVYGKVIKLPKGSNAVKVMENIKIPKNKLWYVLVEKQDNELHMVKHNQKEGVISNQFVTELKNHYIKMFKESKELVALIEQIQIVGNDKFSIIKNIPNIEIDGKKMLSRITEDLIKLLR